MSLSTTLVRRTALALTAPALAGAALVGASAPASAASCYLFDGVRLTAHDTEESTDEIGLKYLDVNHRVDMQQGNDTDVPDRVFCSYSFEVNLWEWDSGRWFDPHDHLGKITVHVGQIGNEQHAFFTGHGTAYELVYNVTAL